MISAVGYGGGVMIEPRAAFPPLGDRGASESIGGEGGCMEPYPLLTSPYYRHGEQTPWGGAKLRERYGKAIPDERTGESLEIAALPGIAATR